MPQHHLRKKARKVWEGLSPGRFLSSRSRSASPSGIGRLVIEPHLPDSSLVDVSTQGLSTDVPTKKEPLERNPLIHKPSSSPSVTNSLWYIAVEKACVEGGEWIREFKEASQNSTDSDGLTELAQLIVKMSSEYTDSAIKFKIFKQTIVPRNYIADVVTTLTTIGDVATAFAPPQATAAWSIAKTLLQIPVATAEQMGAIIGTVELFVRTIRRCQLYETIYNQETIEKAILSNLHEALLDWYIAAIEFLANSKTLLEKGQFQQTLNIIFGPSKNSELISNLLKKEEELLREVQACELSRSIKISDQLKRHLNELSSPLTRIDETVARLVGQMDTDRKVELFNFISSVKFGNRHQMVQESRVEGTGEWLLNYHSFQDWWRIPSASTILLLKGTVGTGKTYLTSKAIDYVKGVLQEAKHDEGFAYFYCTRSGGSMVDPLVVLKSIVQQLSHKAFDNDRIQIALQQRCESAKLEKRDLGYKDCRELILESCNLYSKTTIILDALDETDITEHSLAKIIVDITAQSMKPVKVFVSSRPDRAIMDVFDRKYTIEIDSGCQESDIEKYLDERVYSQTWFENHNDKSKQLIRQTFKSKSQGMFRWVHLQTQTLMDLTTSGAIEDWAKNIPKNLKETYDQLLGKIKNPNDLALAKRAIKWVIGSVKAGWGYNYYIVSPPHINVVLEAIRYIPKGNGELERDERITRDQLLHLCRNLLTIDKDDHVVFPHASVAEYFETKGLTLAKCDLFISTTLLGWLINPKFGFGEWEAEVNGCRFNHPLSKLRGELNEFKHYAVIAWYRHVRRYDDWLGTEKKTANLNMSTLLKGFLGSPQESSSQYRKWITTFYPYQEELTPTHISLFAVCRFGFYHCLRDWWDGGLSCQLAQGFTWRRWGMDCLALAINGRNAAGYLHLAGLVDSNYPPKRLQTAFYFCAKQGIDINVPILIAEKAMLSKDHARSICMENRGEIALEAARNHPRMLEWLLTKNYIDADSDVHDSLGGMMKVLGAAVQGSTHSLEASEILIREGASVNAVTKSAEYASALIIAAMPWRERELVQFLVEKGANTNFVAESGEFGCALEASIYRGESEENAFFLLEKVTDAHLMTTFSVGHHGSVLAAAAYWARRDLLKAMVCRLGQEAALETLRQSPVFKSSGVSADDNRFQARRKGIALFLKEEIRGVDDELLYKIGVLPEYQIPYYIITILNG